MADVAVVLLDSEGQVFAGEQLPFWDQAVEALPVIGQEGVALDADPVEKPSAGRIITPTQLAARRRSGWSKVRNSPAAPLEARWSASAKSSPASNQLRARAKTGGSSATTPGSPSSL